MTTPRENLLKVFRHQMPDSIPLVGMVDNYQVPVGMAEETDAQLNIVSFSRHFGLDVMERYEEARYEKLGEVRRYEKPLLKEVYRDVSYRVEQEDKRVRRVWETPHGMITTTLENVQYDVGSAAEIGTEFPVEYPVKGPDDFKAFSRIFEDMDYELDPKAVKALDARIAEIGDDGLTILWAPSSPLGMCVRYFMGVETLVYANYRNRKELEALLEVIGENYLKKQRLLAGLNADGTNNADDTTTRAINPTMFRELEIPYLKRAAAVNHGHGKLYIHHSCGHINNLLDLYTQTDMDAVDLLTVQPLGDCTIAEAKRRLSGKVVMMPGFETLTMDRGSHDEIRAMVRQFFEDARPGDNFIPVLYPQPNTSTVKRLQVVVDEARKWQHQVG